MGYFDLEDFFLVTMIVRVAIIRWIFWETSIRVVCVVEGRIHIGK